MYIRAFTLAGDSNMPEVVGNVDGGGSPINCSRIGEKGSPFNHRKSMESMEISSTNKQDRLTCCTACRKYRWPIAFVVACILIVVGVVAKLYWPKMPNLKVRYWSFSWKLSLCSWILVLKISNFELLFYLKFKCRRVAQKKSSLSP